MSKDTPSADDGLLVGPSDINGRKGIPAQMPDGKIWRVGGGEIIMNEKASTKHCEQLSKWNVETGGKEFSCDDQKKANTDRASGKMPKNEYHNERAAGGKKLTASFDLNNFIATWRAGNGETFVNEFVDEQGNLIQNPEDSELKEIASKASEIYYRAKGYEHGDGSRYGTAMYKAGVPFYFGLNDDEPMEAINYKDKVFGAYRSKNKKASGGAGPEDAAGAAHFNLSRQVLAFISHSPNGVTVEAIDGQFPHISKTKINEAVESLVAHKSASVVGERIVAGSEGCGHEQDMEAAASGNKPASFYDVMWQKPDGTMEIVQYEYPLGSGTYQAARQKPMAVAKWIANKERNRYKAGTIWAVRQDNQWAKLRLAGGGVAEAGKAATGGDQLSDGQILIRYPKLGKPQVQKIYAQVDEILKKDTITDADKYILEQYEGLGSQTQTGIIDKGLLHQFYTPYIVVKKMYDLAYHYGFEGGNICEPSMGTGRFFKYAPAGSKLIGFDPDKKNIDIAKVLYPEAEIHMEAFETAFLEPPRFNRMAKKAWLPEIDLVIGNPPYGDYMGYYKSYMPSVFKRFEFLFVWLGLKLLRKDGLLVFIVSQNFMNNGAMYNNMKSKILELATFVDAIRMPNKIFSSTDVGTDVVIFRKK